MYGSPYGSRFGVVFSIRSQSPNKIGRPPFESARCDLLFGTLLTHFGHTREKLSASEKAAVDYHMVVW